MRRWLLVLYLSSVVALGGCATARPSAEEDRPYDCESTQRPQWVRYDWLDEHPGAKAAAIGGLVVVVLGCSALFLLGEVALLKNSKGPVTLP